MEKKKEEKSREKNQKFLHVFNQLQIYNDNYLKKNDECKPSIVKCSAMSVLSTIMRMLIHDNTIMNTLDTR